MEYHLSDPDVVLACTVAIVRAYVSRNFVPVASLPTLIRSVYGALRLLSSLG